jgi:translation initiation factor 1
MMNRIVYDSDFGRTTCEVCQRPVARCKCPQLPPSALASGSSDGIVRMRREVRRGKPTTVIVGLPLSEAELRDLAATLKKKCGSGGSAKDGQIEIQGDHRSLLQSELEGRGYRVKLAGG